MAIARKGIIFFFILLYAGIAPAENKIYGIKDAYDAALRSNEAVKIAEEGVLQAESRVDQAWTYIYPRLTGDYGYTRYNEELPHGAQSVFQPLEQTRAGLNLSQPLYTGGRTSAAYRTAKKLKDASSGALVLTRQDVLFNVAAAYYEALKAQKAVEISKGSLSRMERHKEITEREAATRKSKANRSALLRANTLVSQANIFLVRDQDRLKIARQRLFLLTGLSAEAAISEPPSLEQPAESIEQLEAIAVENRADFANARIQQDAASENIAIVRGGHYPQLYAEAAYRYQDSEPMNILDGSSYYGGLRLMVPIFEGGLMNAQVSEARSKLRQAELSRQLMQKSIELEVYEAHVSLHTVNSVLSTARLQREHAKGNFDAVEGLFAEGLAPSLSLIDAEQALSQAERELANAAYDQQVAILRLKKSAGVLGRE